MFRKQKYAVVIISAVFLASVAISIANSEENIVSSAEEIAASWEDLLSSNLSIVIYDPEMKYWYVSRPSIVNRSLDYKIKKTESADTPYELKIRLSYNRQHNRLSPNANSDYKYENQIQGFKTAEDALANTGSTDFKEAKYNYEEKISRNMNVVYVLDNKNWMLKGGNENFDKYIGQYITDANNARQFKDVISVPIE